MNNHELKTRREFLRTGLLGGSLSWTLPAFLSRTMQTLHAQADGALIQGVTGRDGNILVVLQLAGGNDGLNTVIPTGNDEYRKARPTLGLTDSSILRIDPATGLHPSLSGLASLLLCSASSLLLGFFFEGLSARSVRSPSLSLRAAMGPRPFPRCLARSVVFLPCLCPAWGVPSPSPLSLLSLAWLVARGASLRVSARGWAWVPRC